MTKKIPAALKKYFWDVDIKTVDIKKHKRYIIERLLEHGDEKAVRFLRETYTEKEIRAVLTSSRNLSRRSANFWAQIFSVPPRALICLKQPYRERRATHWIE